MSIIIHLSLFLLQIAFILFFLKQNLVLENLILKKQIFILNRSLVSRKKRLRFSAIFRIIFALLLKYFHHIKSAIIIVQPKTVLVWYKKYIKSFWTYKHKKSPGRPRVIKEIRELVLKIKNHNLTCGCLKIAGELKKLGISLSHETIRKILFTYRKQGKVINTFTWKKFITSHFKSIYSMDFFTVDTLFGKRFYVLVFLELKRRKIIQFAVTQHPTREFVRQQIIDFRESVEGKIILIHDNGPELYCLNYSDYDMKAVTTSIRAPDMNAHVERLIGSIRREALDYFIIFSEKQLKNLLKQYVQYYNHFRPHQGISNEIPYHKPVRKTGKIKSMPVLYGLFHHFYRKAS